MKKIFISYRRGTAAWQTHAIRDALAERLPKPDENIFFDLDSIPKATNFRERIAAAIEQSDVFLAIIGEDWLWARDPQTGSRRLNDPEDPVRVEIRTALEQGISILPILLDGVDVPHATQLPDDIKMLSDWNGVEVRRESFETDLEKIVEGILGEKSKPPKERSVFPAFFGAIVLALIAAGTTAYFLRDFYLEEMRTSVAQAVAEERSAQEALAISEAEGALLAERQQLRDDIVGCWKTKDFNIAPGEICFEFDLTVNGDSVLTQCSYASVATPGTLTDLYSEDPRYMYSLVTTNDNIYTYINDKLLMEAGGRLIAIFERCSRFE